MICVSGVDFSIRKKLKQTLKLYSYCYCYSYRPWSEQTLTVELLFWDEFMIKCYQCYFCVWNLLHLNRHQSQCNSLPNRQCNTELQVIYYIEVKV